MRKDKVIKSSLETKINIHSIEKYKSHFSNVDLSDFFICSEVDLNLDANKKNNIKLKSFEGIEVNIEKSPGEKCNHCWKVKEKSCGRTYCGIK